MVDPLGALVAAAGKAVDPAATEAAKTASGLMANLFGPLTGQMGQDLLAKYKNRNVSRVAKLAAAKGSSEAGSIPPRVGGAVFDAASFADDELVAEYLSGVLASSRSQEGRDDSGVTWTALVARLSSDQLRLHFMLYSSAAVLLRGVRLDSLDVFRHERIYVPVAPLLRHFATPDSTRRFNESLMNLVREGLVNDNYMLQTEGAKLSSERAVPDEPGLVFRASPAGVGLFLWGLGLGRHSVLRLNELDIPIPDNWDAPIPLEGSMRYELIPLRSAGQPKEAL
jgi:hypothetical protein